MEILVTISTRSGTLNSPLVNLGTQCMTLIIHGPESVQELRDTHCKKYIDPVMKWLDSIRLYGTGILPERFEDLMRDFAICFGNANTHGIIWDRGDSCVEFTMVFTNMPMYRGGRVHDHESLQYLTRDLTLSPAWQD